MMGEKVGDEIDMDAYVSVELSINHEIVNVKRKRLILKSEKDKLNSSDKSRSRSRDRDS